MSSKLCISNHKEFRQRRI